MSEISIPPYDNEGFSSDEQEFIDTAVEAVYGKLRLWFIFLTSVFVGGLISIPIVDIVSTVMAAMA